MQPLPDPVQPTTANITKVKMNLTNLQRFNDVFYTYTISKCANAFLLLGKNDTNDPGMEIGINLLCGVMIGIGGEYGVLGCVVANYFCGLVSQFSETKPPSLLASFASYITRIQATSIQADHDMAVDYTDPVDNWYTVKTGTFKTPWGTQTLGCCLGQLAAVEFPAETDPLFDQMLIRGLFSFDQTLWWTILINSFQINAWSVSTPPEYLTSKYSEDWINTYCKNLNIKYPASNNTWSIVLIRNFVIGKKKPYYLVSESDLGIAPIKGKTQTISDAAARYLFIDSIPGDIVNPNGLFNRCFIFNSCGIRVVRQIV